MRRKETCKLEALDYWKKNKIEPYYKKSDLIKIDRHMKTIKK